MNKLLTYNIAILISFTILFLVKQFWVDKFVTDEVIAISLTSLTTLGIFNFIVVLLFRLERSYFWKFNKGRPNLSGMWKAIYVNDRREKGESCYSIVEISEDINSVTINGTNYIDGTIAYHSIWKSESYQMENGQFTYQYVLTSAREGAMRTGRTILNLTKENNPKILYGIFADSSPSTNRGRIEFHKIEKKNYKKYKVHIE